MLSGVRIECGMEFVSAPRESVSEVKLRCKLHTARNRDVAAADEAEVRAVDDCIRKTEGWRVGRILRFTAQFEVARLVEAYALAERGVELKERRSCQRGEYIATTRICSGVIWAAIWRMMWAYSVPPRFSFLKSMSCRTR